MRVLTQEQKEKMREICRNWYRKKVATDPDFIRRSMIRQAERRGFNSRPRTRTPKSKFTIRYGKVFVYFQD